MPTSHPPGIAFTPRLPSMLVERHELVQAVERGSERPLLIVRGATGGGKSTVLAAWARAYPRPGVWIGLDRSAADRLVFWRQVVDAIRDAHLVAPDSALHDLEMSVEIAGRLRTLLLSGLNSVPEPITVVLDDFHEVSESVEDDVHWLLERGASVRFVIATRTASVLERPDRMARVDTALVMPASLSFHREEVVAAAELFDAHGAADAIHGAFGGWPLPTRAALLQLRDGTATTVEQAIERVHEVGDSFVVDLLDAAGYGDFLLRISIARAISRELAREMGGSEADLHLAQAEQDGLGTWSVGAHGAEFVLHPRLRNRLELQFIARRPDQVAEARRAYARDLGEQGEAVEAARQYAIIGDGSSLTQLVRRYYGDLLLQHKTFSEILDLLDESQLRRYPELLAMQLMAANAGGHVGRLGLARTVSLVTAVVYSRLGGGKPVDRVSLLLVLLATQRIGGQFDQALKTAERLVTALSLLSEDDREALKGMLPRAWTQLATTFFYNQQAARAEESLAVAVDLSQTLARPWARLHAESLHDLILATRGDVVALAPRLEAARSRQSPSGWRGTYSAAGYHLAEAYHALESFDGETARQQIGELSPHELTIEHWPLIARVRALASLVDGQPYLGLQSLASDIAAHADRPGISASMSSILAATRADLLLADGQPHRAAEVLKPARHDPPAQLVRARVHLVLGEYDRALALAAPLAWAEENRLRAKAESLLIVAAASHRLNQLSDAREAAERAVALLDTFGLRRPLMTVPRADAIAVLESAGISHDELLDGVPDVFAPSARDWSLTATELRVLVLLEASGRIDGLAAELGVSANTVKSHLRQVYKKLGVRSRSEALGVAALHGLLTAEPVDERMRDSRSS